ncbi:MAG: Gfo/Idh/MocA family protein [Acidimicrobiia bacterium]
MRVALVGAGVMGSLHARVISESSRARLYAVIDSDLGRATALADQIGCRATSDLEVATRCDAVIVATSTETHRDVALPLIKAGLPLLIEKPLAVEYEDVAAMIKASEMHDVPIMCGFVERFNPVINLATDMLDAPPIHVLAVRHSPFNPRASSSVVGDLLVHDVDLAVHFAGGAKPDRVVGTMWTPPGSEVSEIADCTVRFSNGMVATLSSSRQSQRKVRNLTISTPSQLIELDLLRQDITVYRHVRHEQVGGPSTAYRAETVVDIPFVRQAGEPLALQFQYFLELAAGRIDPEAERSQLLPAHDIISRIVAI